MNTSHKKITVIDVDPLFFFLSQVKIIVIPYSNSNHDSKCCCYVLKVQLATNRLWLCDCAAGSVGGSLQWTQAKLSSFFCQPCGNMASWRACVCLLSQIQNNDLNTLPMKTHGLMLSRSWNNRQMLWVWGPCIPLIALTAASAALWRSCGGMLSTMQRSHCGSETRPRCNFINVGF